MLMYQVLFCMEKKPTNTTQENNNLISDYIRARYTHEINHDLLKAVTGKNLSESLAEYYHTHETEPFNYLNNWRQNVHKTGAYLQFALKKCWNIKASEREKPWALISVRYDLEDQHAKLEFLKKYCDKNQTHLMLLNLNNQNNIFIQIACDIENIDHALKTLNSSANETSSVTDIISTPKKKQVSWGLLKNHHE